MTARGEPFSCCGGQTVLDLDPLAGGKGSRTVERLLHVHPVIQPVGHDMRMTDRLIGTAHHAERHYKAQRHRERRSPQSPH